MQEVKIKGSQEHTHVKSCLNRPGSGAKDEGQAGRGGLFCFANGERACCLGLE
mgnify:FL=1